LHAMKSVLRLPAIISHECELIQHVLVRQGVASRNSPPEVASRRALLA
jgi:hypothetical protein